MRPWRVMGLAIFLGLSTWPLLGPSDTQRVGAAAHQQTVELRASEFRFDPERIRVKPGAIRFVVHNVGDMRHVLTVEWEGGLGGASIRVPPGQTRTLDVTLEQPGSYVFFCPLETEAEGGGVTVHRDQGMEGQLLVAHE